MNQETRFRVNTPKITHQTVDGEVVMINFDSGCYYSLSKSGAEIWDLVAKALPVETVVTHLQGKYPNAAEVADSVHTLLRQLQEEHLICPAEANVPAGEPPAETATPDSFEKPELQKYDDMQALLLIDPIHEVDEAGWPVADPALTTGK